MVGKPPRWAWLDHGGMWGEHSSEQCHVAHADPFSVVDRDDLANGDGNVCRRCGVYRSHLESELPLRESAGTPPDDDSVTTRHAR